MSSKPEEFTKDSTILLVSPHTSQRGGLRKILTDAGFANKNIQVAGDFDGAQAILGGSQKIDLIITDDEIGKNHNGLDLFKLHQKNHPAASERLFILLKDADVTPFVMADFVLRGGQTILSKPFKNDDFLNSVLGVFRDRKKMGPEQKQALDVRDAICRGDLALAEELVNGFKKKDNHFALFAQGLLQEAARNYPAALEHLLEAGKSKTNFLNLTAIVRVGVKEREYQRVIPYVEEWLEKYPLHHESINDITRVILASKKFELLDELFRIFTENDILDNFVKLPLAAGFVMVSSSYLEEGKSEKAKEYALKAIEYSCQRMPIMVRAIENLAKLGATAEAEQAYLKHTISGELLEDRIYDLRIQSILYSKEKTLEECMKLLNSKEQHPELFKLLIDTLRSLGRDHHEMLVKARRAFPDQDWQ